MAETRGSKGYILPEIIDPNELVCVKVYIPKGDEYLRAFSGHLHRLGTWQVWEKDNTTRAAQASLVWKNALDFTMLNGWLDSCGDCMNEECCNAIVEAINNLQLTVNVSGGGGGGCCSVDKTWKLPDGFEDDLPAEFPPISTDETELLEQQLCDQAHQTHAKIREFFDAFADLTGELNPYDELLALAIGTGLLALPTPFKLIELLTLGSLALYELLERDTLDFWDNMLDDFACAMISHTNAQSFYDWLVGYVREFAPNVFVAQWMLAVLQMPEWSLIYDGAFDIEPEYENSTCDCMEASEWGYVIEIGGGGSTATYVNNTQLEHDFSATIIGAGAGGSYQEVRDALLQFVGVPADETGLTAVSFRIEGIISAPAGNGANRHINYGSVNNSTSIVLANNPNGQAEYHAFDLTVYLALVGEILPETHDIELNVIIEKLFPQFLCGAISYQIAPTTWAYTVSDFTLYT